MKKNFEEPNFEKTEFEAVAYLCGNSNGSNSNSNSNKHKGSNKQQMPGGAGPENGCRPPRH